jgi:hypothetical protein
VTDDEAFELGLQVLGTGWPWRWARGQFYVERNYFGTGMTVAGLVRSVWSAAGEEYDGQPKHVDHHDGGFGTIAGTIVPDFRDVGTLRHALEQLRENLGDPRVHLVPEIGVGGSYIGWRVRTTALGDLPLTSNGVRWLEHERDALVAALIHVRQVDRG